MRLVTKKIKRKSGFYWVKYNTNWSIAEWLNGTKRWYMVGSSYVYTDHEMDQVNEVIIKHYKGK